MEEKKLPLAELDEPCIYGPPPVYGPPQQPREPDPQPAPQKRRVSPFEFWLTIGVFILLMICCIIVLFIV